MINNCSKHPLNVKGYDSIDVLAEEISKLNYFSNRKLYKKLAEIYKAQAEEDYKRGRKQLSSNLEKLAKAFESVVKETEKVCKSCAKHLQNPYKNSE
jgi:DNA-binding ferritin-like protein